MRNWFTRQDGFFLLLAIGLVGLYVFLGSQRDQMGFPLDDSWIHQVYARNLAEHGEWAFVAGKSSAASTAPLYAALLAIGHLVNLAPFAWVYSLGILSLTFAAVMGSRIGEQLFPQIPFISFGTGFVILFAWHHVWAAASGMETMQFMALSLTVIWLAFREIPPQEETPTKPLSKRQAEKQAIRQKKEERSETGFRPIFWRGAILGIAGGLLTLTRPEGVVLVGLIGLLMLISVGWNDMPRYLVWSAGVIIGWLVIISPYTLWNYQLTGALLPSTASAKIAENAPFREDSLPIRYLNMIIPLIAGAQLLALPAILVGIGLKVREARQNLRGVLYLVPALWAVAHLSIFALRLPAPYQHGRYVIPILPPLLIYAVGGLGYLLLRYKTTPIGRVLTRTLAISVFISFPAFAWIGGNAYANDVRIINTEMVETAKWVRDTVPPADLFAVHDIGALGYYAPRDIVDLAGLVTPDIVPIINDYPAQMAFLCEQGAKWLMVLPDQRPAPADDPRLVLRYESPYDFADAARGETTEPWKMRVYELACKVDLTQ